MRMHGHGAHDDASYVPAELLAQWAEHDPIELQRQRVAALGVDVDALEREVLASTYLHAAEMTYPVRASRTGKARTGRMWAYVRDERAWGSHRPPMVMFRFTSDRTGRQARVQLPGFQGTLHIASSRAFDRLLAELGHEPSVVGVARLWAPYAATLIIDEADAHLASAVEDAGLRCVVAPTVMSGPREAAALGRTVLDADPGAV